jgi:hypothetical protein
VLDEKPASVAFEGKTYTVRPAAIEVHAGVISGEVTDMRVVQRVEKGAGGVLLSPRLAGTLRLWSTSDTHRVRLVVAKIQYLDDQWRPMNLVDAGTQEVFRFTTNGDGWLDPGQEAIRSIDVGFPPEALTARKLLALRLEIGYVSVPFREEIFHFAVSIGSQ